MEAAVCKQVTTVKFWDTYAKWYKLWIEHTHYHERIVDVLMTMIQPNWKALDIGAGNGILSIPLYTRGCKVTAREPSINMRSLLYAQAFKHRIEGLTIDERIWEAVPCHQYSDYDLIIACNTLHLTQIGFEEALAKVFRAGPKNVFIVSEPNSPNIWVKRFHDDYRLLFTKSYEEENSYAYHHLNEMLEHWTFIKGRTPQPDEISDLKKRIVVQEGHLWIKNISRVMMCWWKRDGRK
jgi:ubiquinone/menaquinone biosynthesis C-methylase UbiE